MSENDKLHEECAVFGVSLNSGEDAAPTICDALLSLQHRGQEGSGIAVASENRISVYKDIGLVSEVFGDDKIQKLPPASSGIGHNRYSTTGMNIISNVQPFVTEFLTGRIATAHNGNIVNAEELKAELRSQGVRFESTSDSEVISSLCGYYIAKYHDVKKGLAEACAKLDGSFSLIILCGDGSIAALRDGDGYRPLCIGKNAGGIAVSSESCGLDSCGFEFVRDIHPGEIVIIKNGKIESEEILINPHGKRKGLCVFEYVYFARVDSVIDGLSVYEARKSMGRELFAEFPVEADCVCGVPDSGLEAAAGYAEASGIPLVSGFVKNRYIGRSFIYPTQAQRENAVRLKLNPLSINIRDKRVVLVDDSIVRGTTSRKIVSALKQAGAKEVHLRISSPPFRFSCHYGTDIACEDSLIANKMSNEEICKFIGADSLGYISIGGLKQACCKSQMNFCTDCFTGDSVNNRQK